MILTIFDFDDTLFPSSAFCEENVFEGEIVETFRKSIISLIEEAKTHSDLVMVVTCANISWVSICENRMIGLLAGVPVISCYELEGKFPVSEWKKIAFLKIANRFFTSNGDTLIAFGDSLHDREACLEVKKHYPQTTVKSILFDVNPTYEKLLAEQKLIRRYFSAIFGYHGHLDLMLHSVRENLQTTSHSSGESGDSGNSRDSSGIVKVGKIVGDVNPSFRGIGKVVVESSSMISVGID